MGTACDRSDAEDGTTIFPILASPAPPCCYHLAMASAVLPAAGRSRRMGRPKLLLPWGGTTVLGAVVETLRAAEVDPIAVVTARGDEALRQWVEEREVLAAVNPRPERGMLSSVWEGLAALGGAEALARRGEPLLVMPSDLPALRPATVRTLLRRLGSSTRLLAVPVYRGRRGHPVVFAAALIPELLRLDLGVGPRQIFHLHPGDILEVDVDDPGCRADLDTPADYRRLAPNRS